MAEQIKNLKGEIQGLRESLLNNSEGALSSAAPDNNDDGVSKIKVRRVLKGHFGKIYALHWAGPSDADKVVSASQDGKLIIWNAMTCNKKNAVPLRSSWVMTCAFETCDNQLVACGGLDNLCSIYNVGIDVTEGQGKTEQELAHHDGYLSCCRFVNKGEILTSSGDSNCILWDIETAQPKKHFSGHESDVMCVSISPSSPDVFVSGSCDSKCMVWDMRASSSFPTQTYIGHESDINSVAFFPDGHAFGTASDDSSCRIFDMRANTQVGALMNDSILCGVTSVSFSSSGRFLAAGYDDYKFRVWDIFTEGKFNSNENHSNRVSCIGTASSGNAFCTGSWDTFLNAWA